MKNLFVYVKFFFKKWDRHERLGNIFEVVFPLEGHILLKKLGEFTKSIIYLY